MVTVEQGRVTSVSDAEFTVKFSGRIGEWKVPLRSMGRLAYDQEGPKIDSPSLEQRTIVPQKGNSAFVAMDWEPELGEALCWAPAEAVMVRA